MSRSANALLAASRPCSTTASSSAVRSGTVAIRQCSITWSRSNTPSTVLVFPMSMVSSIGPSPASATGTLSMSRVPPTVAATASTAGPARPGGTGANVAGSTSAR